MKAILISIGALLCLAGPGWTQDAKDPKKPKEVKDPKDAKDPKKPKEEPREPPDAKDPKDANDPKKPAEKTRSPFLFRYGYEVNEKLYPQKTPKETLESIIKAVIDQRMEYMLAHLADPKYVDDKIDAYLKKFADLEHRGKSLHSARLEGARLTALDDQITELLNLPSGQGFVLDNIADASAAARAGLMNKDLLIELNGKKVLHRPAGAFLKELARLPLGQRVDVVVIRAGKRVEIKGLPLADPDPRNRMLAFRRMALETTNLYFEDAVRIRELRQFARDADWKIDGDQAVGSLKQLGPRQVHLKLRDGRWFLENRQ